MTKREIITIRDVGRPKGSLWIVEYQQGTVSSYELIAARDEIEAYQIFERDHQSITPVIPKENEDEQR